mmetsp:Transcript_9008/g.12814  ORF Transcript_9008/g.12814 Transcript_9008/m.12814 type:complete len:365 (-) Transcript_9008:235-1329(-)
MTYVDDLLAIGMKAEETLKEINRTFKFKNDVIQEPENYLGAKLKRKEINGKEVWTITSLDYVKALINNVEECCKEKSRPLSKKADTPMSNEYTPEMDGSPELGKKDITWYQELIGMLRWAIEIGWVDILHEVSILSQYQVSPREGHLEQLLRIVSYLRKRLNLSLHFDSELPMIDYGEFISKAEDFEEMYRDAREELPPDHVEPRGKPVTITAFVDASFASNKKTRQSHSGYIIFVNPAPIMWYSKKQAMVESSTFSSEFMAMKVVVEAIYGLRFKLRSFGIPIIKDGPAYIFCDNQGVVSNSVNVESKLDKKHNSVDYHYVRYAVAASVISISWIATAENLADIFTKRFSWNRRDYLLGNFTY